MKCNLILDVKFVGFVCHLKLLRRWLQFSELTLRLLKTFKPSQASRSASFVACWCFLWHFNSQVFKDENKFDAFICDKCLIDLRKGFDLIDTAKDHEENYFKVRREGVHEKLAKLDKRLGFGINVCRICLSPEAAVSLQSMFDEGSKLCQMMKLVADVDVSWALNLFYFFQLLIVFKVNAENSKQKALMCDPCAKDLEATFMLKDNARFNEAFYFKARRLEPPGAYIDDKKFQIVKVNGVLQAKLVQKRAKVIVNSSRTKRMPRKLKVNLKGKKKPGEKMKINKIKKGNFDCDLCAKVFLSKNGLKLHLQKFHIRKEARKFKCEKCCFTTNYRGALKTHIEGIHEKIIRFECHYCEKKFYLKHQIQLHLTSTHIKPKQFFDETRPYQCTFANCAKFFPLKIELQRHFKAHSGKLFIFNKFYVSQRFLLINRWTTVFLLLWKVI